MSLLDINTEKRGSKHNMRMKHVLLEMYFEDNLNLEEVLDDSNSFEDLVSSGISFTYADYELAYAGKNGIVHTLEDFAGFGGEMDIEPETENYEAVREELIKKWQSVCQRKIEEAVDEYLEIKKQFLQEKGIKDEIE